MAVNNERSRSERNITTVVACGVGFLLLWNMIDGGPSSLAGNDVPVATAGNPDHKRGEPTYELCPMLPAMGPVTNPDAVGVTDRHLVPYHPQCSTPVLDADMSTVLGYVEPGFTVMPLCDVAGTSYTGVSALRPDGTFGPKGYAATGPQSFERPSEKGPLTTCRTPLASGRAG